MLSPKLQLGLILKLRDLVGQYTREQAIAHLSGDRRERRGAKKASKRILDEILDACRAAGASERVARSIALDAFASAGARTVIVDAETSETVARETWEGICQGLDAVGVIDLDEAGRIVAPEDEERSHVLTGWTRTLYHGLFRALRERRLGDPALHIAIAEGAALAAYELTHGDPNSPWWVEEVYLERDTGLRFIERMRLVMTWWASMKFPEGDTPGEREVRISWRMALTESVVDALMRDEPREQDIARRWLADLWRRFGYLPEDADVALGWTGWMMANFGLLAGDVANAVGYAMAALPPEQRPDPDGWRDTARAERYMRNSDLLAGRAETTFGGLHVPNDAAGKGLNVGWDAARATLFEQLATTDGLEQRIAEIRADLEAAAPSVETDEQRE